ncbi:hypothetical protein VTO42DRAFT_8547 [Malbranchea cinnamomea]
MPYRASPYGYVPFDEGLRRPVTRRRNPHDILHYQHGAGRCPSSWYLYYCERRRSFVKITVRCTKETDTAWNLSMHYPRPGGI